MPVPQSKQDLLDAISTSYDRLSTDLARVPPARARETSMPGHTAGTMMSPADLVAYLIGWNRLVLSWHESRSRGAEPDLPATGFGWNQLGALAQQFYLDQAAASWAALLQHLSRAKTDVVELVESMSEQDLYGDPWYGKYTAGRMIQLNTSSPYTNARARIRAWLREQTPANR
ncbi:hypothetical protein ASE14_01005 [Agromyces sp. Root81]|uniref:ClbS/DfsB family four-helix bundle protein n=1 Tax=Agromyces sp. Root81 TaxID=1736601 RepID=UPI00070165BB|nr:ClbS/DfsB family four-helix bundle protein [Agromyces sp. Root81]KRC62447.1 hypothetical protein ASE14_01005 [Agromyces sp. Root81]